MSDERLTLEEAAQKFFPDPANPQRGNVSALFALIDAGRVRVRQDELGRDYVLSDEIRKARILGPILEAEKRCGAHPDWYSTNDAGVSRPVYRGW